MNVAIKLYGPFRTGRFTEEVREVPPGATARTIAEGLRLPAALVETGIVLIGGVHARLDDPLVDGDELSLLPPLEGG
jgi:molybdopterin converting factor small subunit